LNCNGFEVETVMNVRAAKAGLVIQEIPSYEYLRLHGMSNLKVVRDGIRIAKFIFLERFAKRKSAEPLAQEIKRPELPDTRDFTAVAMVVVTSEVK
jgi:hypothetical protein